MLNGLDLFMNHWMSKKGANHPAWKGGKRLDKDGYILIWLPDHPWPRKGYMREHTAVVGLIIGRKIKQTECVHHIDGDRKNNSPDNLELVLKEIHSREHRKKDAHKFPRDKRGRWRGYA